MKTNEKQSLIDRLKKIPILQLACEQSGVSRATLYRWKKEDKDFAKQVDEALHEGRVLINESAESQLIAAIRDRNMTAIIYWLKSNDPRYSERLEVTTKFKPVIEQLTPEQEAVVQEALRLAALTPGKETESNEI